MKLFRDRRRLIPALIFLFVMMTSFAWWETGFGQEPDDTLELAPFEADLEIRLLNIRVSVTDKKGNPVQGLKPGDFRLRVAGIEIPVRYFHEVRGGMMWTPPESGSDADGATPAAAGADASARIDSSEAVSGGVPDSPLAEPSEMAEVQTAPIHYIFFFDNLHMNLRNRPRLLARLNEFVDGSFVGGRDQGLVVHFEQGFNLETRFTSNPGILKDELKRASMQSANPSQLAGETPPTGIGPQAEKSYYAKLSSEALGTLATFLTGVPGKKAVIYLSDGLPVEMGSGLNTGEERGAPSAANVFDDRNALHEAVRQFNAARVPVFTLDAKGLSGDTSIVSAETGGVLYLARETGGKAFTGSGAYLQALEQVRSMLSNYYSIGIRTESWTPDTYQSINLSVPGQSGIEVRFQRGFEEVGEETRTAQDTLLLHFDGRLTRNPLEADALVVNLERLLQGKGHVIRVSLAVVIPHRTLGLVEQKPGTLSGELTLFVAARSDTLTYIPSQKISHQLSFASEGFDPEGVYTYGARLVFPDGNYNLAVGIRDKVTGETSILMAEPVEAAGGG